MKRRVVYCSTCLHSDVPAVLGPWVWDFEFDRSRRSYGEDGTVTSWSEGGLDADVTYTLVETLCGVSLNTSF